LCHSLLRHTIIELLLITGLAAASPSPRANGLAGRALVYTAGLLMFYQKELENARLITKKRAKK